MEEKRKPRLFLVFVTAAFILLVVYPLSLGPLLWLHNKGVITPAVAECIGAFYLPLAFACETVPMPIGIAIEWYLALWGVKV